MRPGCWGNLTVPSGEGHDEGHIKARHAAHNRYEIALDDLEALVDQQAGKEYVNPIERLRTLGQELGTLKEAGRGPQSAGARTDWPGAITGGRITGEAY